MVSFFNKDLHLRKYPFWLIPSLGNQGLLWLVIFPMSGNNTFETSDFADLTSLFEGVRVTRSFPRCVYGVKSSLTKGFERVCLFLLPFDWRKSKEQIAERKNFLDIQINF